MLRRLGAIWPPESCWLPVLFVLAALPSGLFLVAIVPPGQVADEQAHIARADSLTHRQWIGRHFVQTLDDGYSFRDSGVLVDPALFSVAFAVPLNVVDSGSAVARSSLQTMKAAQWTFRPELVEAQNVARYPPIFYLPAAAVLFAAKHIGASPYHAILGGRAVNLLVFVAIGALSLRLAPRPLLLVPLALPMTLSLAASFNPDGLTVATTVLCVALILRLLAAGTTDWTIWIAAAGIGCVIAQRPPLLPIAFLLILPLSGAAWHDARVARIRLGAAWLAAGIGIGWFVVAEHLAGAPVVHPGATSPGPLFAGPPTTVFRTTDAMAQLGVLLHDPRLFITLPVRSLRADLVPELQEFIGVLGWLSLMLPKQLYSAWSVAGAAAVLAEVPRLRDEWRGRPLDWALVLVMIIVTVDLIHIALYLTWDRVGANHIEGPQGRYFLALAAVALFAVPGLRLPFGAVLRQAVLFGVAMLGVVCSIVVPIVVMHVYYLR